MSTFDKVINELVEDGRLLKLSQAEILQLCNERIKQRAQDLVEIKIPGIPDFVYSVFADYAIQQGYDIDDFDELIQAKFYRYFPAKPARQGAEQGSGIEPHKPLISSLISNL